MLISDSTLRPDVARYTHESTPSRDWTPATRAAFRVVFAYYAIFGAASLLDSGNAPRRLLEALRAPVVGFVGHSILRLGDTERSASVPWALAQQLAAILVAAVVAALWSLASRRTEYDRLAGWSRIVLRYYVGGAMMVYGAFKVIPSQFPPITLDQLAQPLGSLTPMGLLWTYMGYSSIYTIFAGLGESVGAFLLFFRRTTTAGALILVAVLSNVALINYAYDVPVKQLSTNLLFAAIVLVAVDARRLLAVFWYNAPTIPADQSFAFGPKWHRARRFVKPTVVSLAAVAPFVASLFVHTNLQRRPPLYGVYDVERFVRNGEEIRPLAGDATRWRRVTFSRPGMMSVQLMTDAPWPLVAIVDSAGHHIVARPSGASTDAVRFDYVRFGGDSIRARGTVSGDSVEVMLRRLDEQALFRLLKR